MTVTARYFGFLYQCMFDGAEWVARWQTLHRVTTSSMWSSSLYRWTYVLWWQLSDLWVDFRSST